MDTKKIIKYLNYIAYFLTGALFLAFILAGIAIEMNKKPPEVVARIKSDMLNQGKLYSTLPQPWPPQMNQKYPDFGLVDQEGKPFKLSDLKGRVIVIDAVDMTLPQSHAYSGANKLGPYNIKKDQLDPNVITFEESLARYTSGKLSWPNPNLVMVKIIFYNASGVQPTPDDAMNWAQHYQLTKANNIIVAVPEKDMRTTATSMILPGFQLIDKEFDLRVDSSGPTPKHSLEMTFIPLIPKLLKIK